MLKRGLLALGAALPLLLPAAPALADIQPQPCQFQLGFADIAGMIPDVVGVCLDNAAPMNPQGDMMQETTNGLLTWTKATNVIEFTTGERTWVNGPYGLILRDGSTNYDWEGASSMVAGVALENGVAVDPVTHKVLPLDAHLRG